MADETQATLANLHDAFAAEKAELAALLRKTFSNAEQAADALLSAVEEFGPQHAIDQLKNTPDQIDTLADNAEPLLHDVIEPRVSRLVDLQDQLDELARDLDLQNTDRPPSVRRLDIQGQMHVFDGVNETLSRDKKAETDRPSTYAEQLAKDLGIPLAEPNPDHERTRTRNR